MKSFSDLVASGRPIVTDGAMGTQLFQAGLQFGDPPETWNVLHPDVIRGIQRRYIQAGSNVILTNTFGGTRFRLSMHNLQTKVPELNRAAVVLLKAEVDASGRDDVVVAGDIGPSGEILAPLGTLVYADAVAGFEEQARALIEAGADVIWVETMSSLEEITAAFEGARRVSPEIPIITTMSFDTHGRTMMGVTPAQALKHLTDLGAAAIGANCGNGTDELMAAVKGMVAAGPRVPLVAKSNAGMPKLVNGKAHYDASPDEMAAYAREVWATGARFIGGCCGSGPEHIAAMAGALRDAPAQNLVTQSEPATEPAANGSASVAERAARRAARRNRD